jgi:DHA2 family methylenomycin A resistance protein-like MFS transporter
VLMPNLLAPWIASKMGAGPTIAAGALVSAASCLALLGIDQGTGYGEIVLPIVFMGAGLGLLVPPLTSTLLGSVDKSRSGIASGVLNSMRQTGSVLGVALFGSLAGSAGAIVPGLRMALVISACLLACSAAAAVIGIPRKQQGGASKPSRGSNSIEAGGRQGLAARAK